ncbi:retrovirus-related pol polyprotein from transposon TNT 1-94 [Tanacetum coccineum]
MLPFRCYLILGVLQDCPKRNNKKSTGFVKKNAGQGSGMHSKGYDNGGLLMAMSDERFLEWIMNSGGSFHMTPGRDFLFDFKEFNGGTVLLGDNRACAIIGTGKVRVQMKDGSSFVLKNVCYISRFEENLISIEQRREIVCTPLDVLGFESSEASVGIQEKESLAQQRETGLTSLHSNSIGEEDTYGFMFRTSANYEMLRILGCVAYSQVNQGKLNREHKTHIPGVILMGVEGIQLDSWEGSLSLGGTSSQILGENPGNKDEEQDEGPQQQNLDNYILVHDREKRTTTIPARYRDEGNVSLSRPSRSKAINSSKKDEWVRALGGRDEFFKEESYLGAGRSTTWVILSLNACEDYELEQLDVKTAFLHGNLEETIYMRQPPNVQQDDMLIACKSKSEIEYTKGLLRKEFDMKELGPTRKILGMEIVRDRGSRTLKVSQSGYLQKILNNYRMDNSKSVSVPLGAHFKGTADVGLVYGRDQGKHVDVDGFVDADYAKDHNKEAKYMALTKAVKESIWLKGLLIELGVNLREIMESKEIEVVKIGTKNNAADAFTKVVPGPKFKYCMQILGVGIN